MGRLLLDACVVINLWAGGVLDELVTACGMELLVTRTVTREAMFIESEEPDGEREAIDWPALQASGQVSGLELTEAEAASFLGFIPRLGDGEASSLAIAGARGMIVATDDALALRLAGEHDPVIETVTTPDIISWWADAAEASDERVADVIARIEARARFTPSNSHPLAEWWRAAARLT